MTCPCGDPRPLEECCQPFISGSAQPDTAEQLMRSRYTAYTLEEIDYILSTYVPEEGQEEADRESTEKWAKESEWLGLDIVDTVAGGKDDDEGVVEFIAKFRLQETDAKHHERSEFKRVDGAWRYLTGEMVKPKPVVRDKPKVGRNEPCPCNSGKKYKRCCGAA